METSHIQINSGTPAVSPAAIKVLLIDDNEDDAMIAQDHLSRVFGRTYQVEWASTYQKGLKTLLEHKHDVCLVDYCLDKGTGLGVLTEATTKGCSIPIVMISGTTDPSLREEAMEHGAANFLFKSEVNAYRLEQVIDQVLGSH